MPKTKVVLDTNVLKNKNHLTCNVRCWILSNPVIWKEQVYWILWKPLPQVSFLVTWAYRISALSQYYTLCPMGFPPCAHLI
jgi:hypothetical protein